MNQEITKAERRKRNNKIAKNVIIFIGDGEQTHYICKI